MKYRINDFGTGYTFDASAKTVTFDTLRAGEHYDLKASDILLIVNSGIIIYRFEDDAKRGTLSGTHNRVLTLDYDTTSMADSDELLIYVDTPDYETKYDAHTSFYVEKDITERGAYFPIDLHAKVSSEGLIAMTDTIHSLAFDDAEDGVLQVFRASTNNIHDILFACRGQSGTTTRDILFDMEYADDASAQSDWTGSNLTDWDVRSDNSPVYAGTYSLRLDVNNTAALNETVTHTFGSAQDWSGATQLDFRKYSSQTTGQLQVFIRDTSNNTMTMNFAYTSSNTWFLQEIIFANMTNFANVDLSAIGEIGFMCLDAGQHVQYYIDEIYLESLESTTSIPVEISLHDFGSNPNVSTLPTAMPLDDGGTTVIRNVNEQARVHNAHLHYGSHATDVELTIGNYYGMYFKRPPFGTVHFLGDASDQSYASGKVSTVTGTTISNIPAKSLGFIVFSNVPGIVTSLDLNFGADASGTHLYLSMLDESSNLKRLLLSTEVGPELSRSFTFSGKSDEIIHTDLYNTLNLVYGDTLGSSVEKVLVQVGFSYNAFPLYG